MYIPIPTRSTVMCNPCMVGPARVRHALREVRLAKEKSHYLSAEEMAKVVALDAKMAGRGEDEELSQEDIKLANEVFDIVDGHLVPQV
ncbi:MAG: hypothetical protein V1885_00025 [Candidatus Brennerbacteria bacterium]